MNAMVLYARLNHSQQRFGPSKIPQENSNNTDYCSVLSKWEFFIKMRAALLAPILPEVMNSSFESK